MLLCVIVFLLQSLVSGFMRDINAVKECELVKSGAVPNVIVQWGEPRSASTLQYMTLLLIGSFLCPNGFLSQYGYFPKLDIQFNNNNYFNNNYSNSLDTTADNSSSESVVKSDSKNKNILFILKTHEIRDLYIFNNNNTLLFASTHNEDRRKFMVEALQSRIYNTTITNIQLFQLPKDVLDDNYYSFLYKYMEIFPMMTKEQMKKIREYLKYWMIFRKCCSSQMSLQWKYYLVNGNYTKKLSDPSHPQCELYNLTNLEIVWRQVTTELRMVPPPQLPGFCQCTIDTTKRQSILVNSHFFYKDCIQQFADHSFDWDNMY